MKNEELNIFPILANEVALLSPQIEPNLYITENDRLLKWHLQIIT